MIIQIETTTDNLEIAKQIADNLPSIMPHSYEYTTEALDMETTIRERMQKLSYAEFEG